MTVQNQLWGLKMDRCTICRGPNVKWNNCNHYKTVFITVILLLYCVSDTHGFKLRDIQVENDDVIIHRQRHDDPAPDHIRQNKLVNNNNNYDKNSDIITDPTPHLSSGKTTADDNLLVTIAKDSNEDIKNSLNANREELAERTESNSVNLKKDTHIIIKPVDLTENNQNVNSGDKSSEIDNKISLISVDNTSVITDPEVKLLSVTLAEKSAENKEQEPVVAVISGVNEGRDVVSEASLPTNTIKAPEVVPNEPIQLKNLVLSLQSQLVEAQTSQVYTRSILNVIQEKQDDQAQDLQFLKDSILDLSIEQKQDRAAIKVLQKMAEDNAWGISDLKTGNDHMRNDFSAFKELQLAHNDTMLELENLAIHNKVDHENYHKSIKHLQHEVLNVKTQLQQNRIGLDRLYSQFLVARKVSSQEFPNKEATTAKPTQNNRERDVLVSVPNNIPLVMPIEHKYDIGFEGSGDKSTEQSREFDKFASSIEEKHNVIGNHIEKILATERKLEKDYERVNKKVSLYEGELAKVYAMFYNLSLQLANIEKKGLTYQQNTFQRDLTNLQESFLNFTQQILYLQNAGIEKLNNNNTIPQVVGNNHHRHNHQKDKAVINNLVEAQNDRMKYLENNLIDSKAANQQAHILFNNQLSNVNETVRTMRKMLTDHNNHAMGVFEEVSGKMVDFKTRLQHNDDRITRMEVKVLNMTLNACEKTNADLTQDNYLNNLDIGLTKVDRKTEDLADKLSKLDRGISLLHERTDTQEHTMTKMLDRVREAITILPSVKGLQKEVQNFISQLPADCDAIAASFPDKQPEDKSYLVHPGKSSSSAWVPCEFGEDDLTTWTIVQRRIDGQQSFANSWEQYKYGFGDPDHEYWIGNDNLHYLTGEGNYMLHIDMWDLHNTHWYAQYDHFQIDGEEDNYSLRIGGFEGNATDAMKYSNYMPFSTMDHDNDVSSTHCAKFYTAGWWYKHCHYGNLNGRYTVGIVWFNHDLDEWVPMQRTTMKIRPKKRSENRYDIDKIETNSTEQKDEGNDLDYLFDDLI